MKRALMILGVVAGGCDSPGDAAGSQADALVDARADALVDARADVGGSDSIPTGSADTSETPDDNDQLGTGSVCQRWLADRAERDEGGWSGSANQCEPGEYAEPGPTNTLRQVNLYRFMAGLPEVELSATKSAQAQECALLMHANRTIEHVVPTSWSCYTSAGSGAARLSNLATTAGVLSIDLYMTDDGIDNLGHRRWLLSNSLGPIGVGSTSSFSCLHVLSGDGRAGKRWTAWPPPGEVPVDALHIANWMDVDSAGWSVQSDYIDLRDGLVTVTHSGSPQQVDVWSLDEGYGSTFGLGIRPRGWKTEVGETYRVEIANVAEVIEYEFTVVICR